MYIEKIRIRIRPRVLIDVSNRDLGCNILGINLDFPIAIAPTSVQRLLHSDGENATAKGILILTCTFRIYKIS